jgi:hypothetical protein
MHGRSTRYVHPAHTEPVTHYVIELGEELRAKDYQPGERWWHEYAVMVESAVGGVAAEDLPVLVPMVRAAWEVAGRSSSSMLSGLVRPMIRSCSAFGRAVQSA